MSEARTIGDVFALNPEARPEVVEIAGQPIFVVDDFFVAPEAVREAASKLHFIRHGRSYPGRLASVPREDLRFRTFLGTVQALANREYLPHLNARATAEKTDEISIVKGDFAIIDYHPSELNEHQKRPHTDPMPIFGIVYLSAEDLGGTLFFETLGSEADDEPSDLQGYFSESNGRWRLAGKAAGTFNRLVMFPGELPHTGEIKGDWILSEKRLSNPRLTMRLLFHNEQSFEQLSRRGH